MAEGWTVTINGPITRTFRQRNQAETFFAAYIRIHAQKRRAPGEADWVTLTDPSGQLLQSAHFPYWGGPSSSDAPA